MKRFLAIFLVLLLFAPIVVQAEGLGINRYEFIGRFIEATYFSLFPHSVTIYNFSPAEDAQNVNMIYFSDDLFMSLSHFPENDELFYVGASISSNDASTILNFLSLITEIAYATGAITEMDPYWSDGSQVENFLYQMRFLEDEPIAPGDSHKLIIDGLQYQWYCDEEAGILFYVSPIY